MAIYNNWTDAMSLEELNLAVKEIYSGIPGVTVSDIASDVFTVSFDDSHSANIAATAGSCGVTVDGKNVKISSGTTAVTFKYYAKANGEMLITTTGSAATSIQWGIGKTTDGDWGAVHMGKSGSTTVYDQMIATGSGATKTATRYITNSGSTDTNYIALRRCVKHTDVLFENIFVHTEGAPNQWVKLEVNGEQYITGTNNTGNNDMLILKL